MKAIQVVRSVSFFVGFIGVILVVLGFWYDTKELGGVLCAVGLIGHLATRNRLKED